MRYPLMNGERGKNPRKNAKQPARLENRGPQGSSQKVRNRVSPAGDKSCDISSSRRGRRRSSSEAGQAGLHQNVRRADRQDSRIRVTKQLLEQYPFQIRPLTEEEGGGYLIEFPDLPGCMSDGETPEEAIVNVRDALKCCLLTMREFEDPIPPPDSSTTPSGQWRQRVPKSLHARLTARAEREGVSLNTLVTTLIAQGLGERAAR